jgi:hypothetical protein
MQERNMINSNFIIIGIIVYLTGSSSYFFDTIKGRIKPNRVSWFFWSLAPLITFGVEYTSGVGISAVPILIAGILTLATFIASLINKAAYWKVTRFDLFCGILAFIGLILWLITKNGPIAIILCILSDISASIPTVVKTFTYPESENRYEYFGAVINAGMTLLTLKYWTFTAFAFPAYIVIIDSLVFFLIIRKKSQSTML